MISLSGRRWGLLAALVLTVSCVAAEVEPAPTVTGVPSIILVKPESGATISQLNAAQKSFLTLPRKERMGVFADAEKRRQLVKEAGYHPQPIEFSWRHPGQEGAECTLHVSYDQEFAKERTATSREGVALIDSLRMHSRYYWKVTGKATDGHLVASPTWTFVTADESPRLMTIEGVPNVRDFGGRKAMDGKRVRQDLVFRSAGLNENAKGTQPGPSRLNDATRTYMLEWLGIKTDIDLRSDRECFGMTGSPLGPTVTWAHHSSSAYKGMQDTGGKDAFVQSFKVFCDEKNYPIVFHCIAGQDRTGSLAFILNGLLGVDEEELFKDWEVSGFWNKDPSFSHHQRFNKLVEGFQANYPQPTWQLKMEAYVKSLGVSQADIDRFRTIMLEEDR